MAEKSGWSSPAPPGHVRGIAFAEAFRTIVAQVVELSAKGKAITIHRVTTAVDCGIVVDPGNSRNQIEGGVAWGLSAAFKSEITFARGRARVASARSDR